jgi:hypothetical protein
MLTCKTAINEAFLSDYLRTYANSCYSFLFKRIIARLFVCSMVYEKYMSISTEKKSVAVVRPKKKNDQFRTCKTDTSSFPMVRLRR